MAELISLWIPIVAAALATHIASTIAWTVAPHHKPDVTPLPDDQLIGELIKKNNLGPGAYMFPGIDYNDWNNPEVKARFDAGPFGMVMIWNKPNMGINIGLTLLFFFVASFFLGYVASVALEPGAPFMKVFQLVGTVGVMTYCFASVPNDIWFRRPTRWFLTNKLDGIIYGLIAGLVFASLWPQ